MEHLLKGGLQQKHFTKRLYEHLHLHCGFIAHYNINGFYETYFNGDYNDLSRFLDQFKGASMNAGYSCYQDIHKSMLECLNKFEQDLNSSAQENNNEKFELLKELVRRSENDTDLRNKVVSQYFN